MRLATLFAAAETKSPEVKAERYGAPPPGGPRRPCLPPHGQGRIHFPITTSSEKAQEFSTGRGRNAFLLGYRS